MQSLPAMPRKQRFKPSRKPKQETVVPASNTDDRREVHPDDVDIETGTVAHRAPDHDQSAIEKTGS